SYIGSLPPLFLELIFLDKTECTWKSTALVPYDFAQQPIVYYSILVVQAIGNCLNCIIACTSDTFGFLLISLLCGHIEVLSLHLKKIGNFERRSANDSNRLRLLEQLNHHGLLTDYATELNNHLSAIFFVQVSISAPIICTCAYQFSQAQNFTTTQLIFLASYTIGMLLQIITPSYASTNLMEKCDSLPVAIFSSEWYELGPSEKKSLLIFLTRSIRPFVMNAGNYFQMNTTTFLKIVKTAYSLLAVLQSTQP
ncbi:odorant receptor 33c-like, partial [Sitodiplosis mosellana]|uniref:odorant receptor 33c-like n=1 Tax=Sitodiplosis mosellana TaxID=263140 RepID=UPI0024442199